jgi:lipoate-protein ligase B
MELASIDASFDFLPAPSHWEIEARDLGKQAYSPVLETVKTYTRLKKRPPELTLNDQLWVVEHDPMYISGSSTRENHLP